MKRNRLPDAIVIVLLIVVLAGLFFWRRELLAFVMSIGRR